MAAAEWRRVLGGAAGRLAESWQRGPLVLLRSEPLLAGHTALADVAPLVDGGLMPAGRASLSGRGDWASAPLGGSLERVLAESTAYANNAGMYMPSLAELCLAATDALGWPTTCNVYMSDPGRAVSVPPHTDRQDVLVLQTSGRKRWTVYAPTPVGEADPLRRGKDGDAICRDSLGGPLLDVTLLPGDLLYVPLGFPHETSTVCTASCGRSREDGPAALDPSVHITVNVDSLIWGLSYRLLWAAAQRGARLHAGLADAPEEAASTAGMSWERYSALQSPLPLGFLEGAVSAPAAADARELRRRAATWRGLPSDAEEFSAVADDHVAAAAGMLLRHREAVLRLHRQMYLDVLLGLSSAPPLEREMGHWALLQEQMAALRSEMGWG